jgi:SET and MYND domain-containing protein
MGKLLAVDEFASVPESNMQESFPPTGPARLHLALRNLIEARKELLIGFGHNNGGGQVGEEVRELVISLETEIGIWKDGVRKAWEEQNITNRIMID